MNAREKDNVRLQIQATQAWMVYWQTYISSGAYKSRKLQRPSDKNNPDGGFVWRDCTDEEKLESSIDSLHSHVKRMQDLTDLLIDDPTP